MDITRWSTPNQVDYILCSQRWRSSIHSGKKQTNRSWVWLRSWTPYWKFRLKLKKEGNPTRSFKYDLNQIHYDYTVEVTNTLKGLDLIECLKNYGQTLVTLYRSQRSRPFPRKRHARRQNDCLRRAYKQLRKEEKLKAKEKRKDTPIRMQSFKE